VNEPLSWRLRALELFGDSLGGMLMLGLWLFIWGGRPASWTGTLLWVLALIGGAMAMEAIWAFWLREPFRRHLYPPRTGRSSP
jgi:hypothetical protein